MGKIRAFRLWYYLRTGYQLYFAFVFAAINTMVITYFLAIERAPFLKEVFPSFAHYAVVLILIGLPVLIFTGFIHFKRIPAFKSEQEIAVESNPFIYKLPPGHAKVVAYPWQLLLSKIILKIANNEKISEHEIKQMKELQKKMDVLIGGGYIGIKEGQKLPFSNKNEDNTR